MKNLFLILSLVLIVSCCAPDTNPDDNIDTNSTEKIEDQPRMATITLYYLDGTTKVIKHKWAKVHNYDGYIKIAYENEIFIHVGDYDLTYDR